MRGQRGISYWGVVALIFIVFIGIQFFMAAGSAYMDDFTLNKIIVERLKTAPNDMPIPQLMSSFDQQFDMNGLRDIKAVDRLKVTNDSGIEVIKDYEVRNKFIGNMDLVVHFEKTFDQKSIKAGG
jgi:hypothetical protein